MQSFVFPGNIDPRIMEIGSKPFIYMRTDRFSDIIKETEKMLLDLIHCTNGRTIIYTGSGTGAMSSVVENYVTTKRKAFIIDGGSFGHRWYDMCNYYKVPVYRYEVPFAKDINYEDLESVIKNERPNVLLCQHHETSSGQLFNLKEICHICRKYDVSVVVDAISSFLAEPLSMDELNIDICITSTQKGLNIPPGLSVIFLNKKLYEYSYNHCGYYWDFENNLKNLKRGQTPFSPATILYLQLYTRLKQLIAEGGVEKNIKDIQHRANLFRELCKKNQWQILAERPSYAITGVQTNEINDRAIFNKLIDKYDTYIMPSSQCGFYRVSHMGLQTDDEIISLAERMYQLEKA